MVNYFHGAIFTIHMNMVRVASCTLREALRAHTVGDDSWSSLSIHPYFRLGLNAVPAVCGEAE